MKSVQKLILPLLVAVIVVLIYLTYIVPRKGLGSFSDFDTNSSANKEIKVKLEKEINRDSLNGIATFYAVDKNGTEVLVQAPPEIPKTVKSGQIIILKGHLHPDHFHAVEMAFE